MVILLAIIAMSVTKTPLFEVAYVSYMGFGVLLTLSVIIQISEIIWDLRRKDKDAS